MWTSRLRFGRRRRNPASALLVLVVGFAYVGYDHLCQAWQKQEAWSGTVVRVYREKTFLGGIKSSKNHYRDVWTASGEVRPVRIWSRSLWSGASRGDRIIKREGELHPDVVGRPEGRGNP